MLIGQLLMLDNLGTDIPVVLKALDWHY